MAEIAELLSPKGVWVSEQSYLQSMLDTNSYDTICHEHLEYYGLKQICTLAKKVGLKILDVEFNDVNGGSFAFMAALESSPLPQNKAHIESILEKEEKNSLYSPSTFKNFMERVNKHRSEVKNFFAQAHQDKKRVLGYGASTKGNILLNYCGLSAQELPCIAEVNDDKFGAFTPGTMIPIVSEASARRMNPDYFFVLPWHFKNGILQREKEAMAQGLKFVFPLPHFEVV
jgi:hypothetical protein